MRHARRTTRNTRTRAQVTLEGGINQSGLTRQSVVTFRGVGPATNGRSPYDNCVSNTRAFPGFDSKAENAIEKATDSWLPGVARCGMAVARVRVDVCWRVQWRVWWLLLQAAAWRRPADAAQLKHATKARTQRCLASPWWVWLGTCALRVMRVCPAASCQQ
jgi:hypothetical protein